MPKPTDSIGTHEEHMAEIHQLIDEISVSCSKYHPVVAGTALASVVVAICHETGVSPYVAICSIVAIDAQLSEEEETTSEPEESN